MFIDKKVAELDRLNRFDRKKNTTLFCPPDNKKEPDSTSGGLIPGNSVNYSG
jgi:hypothetical protein